MTYVPLELAERIIDYLQDDKPSLIAASLISRNWTPRCRRYCFRDLQLPKPHYTLQHFIDLCTHPLSTISATYTRKLTLRRPVSLTSWNALFEGLLTPMFGPDDEEPTTIEVLFPNMEEIDIIGVKDPDEWVSLRSLLQSGVLLHRIRRMTMSRCTSSAAGLRDIFNALDILESLTLDEVYIDGRHPNQQPNYALPETLRRLLIRDNLGLVGLCRQLDLRKSTCLALCEVYIDLGRNVTEFISDLQNFLQRTISEGDKRSCTIGVRGTAMTSDQLRGLVFETERSGWEITLKGELHMICRIFVQGFPAGDWDFNPESNLKHVVVEDILGLMNSNRDFQRDFAYFEELLEKDPIFLLIEDVSVEMALKFSEVELREAGWDESELMVVRDSYPHMLMKIMVKKVQELLPYSHNGGLLRVREVYMKREKCIGRM
ncbi:hypothetical protein Moror_14480 [Moniliophthora roreri MCA 2997]|uniref:F-box domain-containing protein n=2 Tax=Moniliophthora roreri TaxID=221103 RepID=V2XRX4_MONRO|nr:hypothetical protein Moror_14480 [Moniliophthora roreri MCA 2997]